MKKLGWGFLLGILLSGQAYGASFDCGKAKSFFEKTVCEIPVLSKLDDELSEKYKAALQARGETVRAEQRQWLKEVSKCTDARCIHTAYLGRISELMTDQSKMNSSSVVASGKESVDKSAIPSPANSTRPMVNRPFDDEVGSKQILVVNPKRPPFRARGPSKYWECEGLVNKIVIESVFEAMVSIARVSKLALPQSGTCYLVQTRIEDLGKVLILYSLNYYVSAASRDICQTTDNCVNWRDATFNPREGGMQVSYTLTDSRGQNPSMACIALSGKIIDPDSQCK
jgi:uncharacterized protein